MLYSPTTLPPDLLSADSVLVVCLCAAWCDTCEEYAQKFEDFSNKYPHITCVWLDIEEDEQFLPPDMDIENFPTLLVEKAEGILFFGVMLPHIQHLERLVRSLPAEPVDSPIRLFSTFRGR